MDAINNAIYPLSVFNLNFHKETKLSSKIWSKLSIERQQNVSETLRTMICSYYRLYLHACIMCYSQYRQLRFERFFCLSVTTIVLLSLETKLFTNSPFSKSIHQSWHFFTNFTQDLFCRSSDVFRSSDVVRLFGVGLCGYAAML